MKKDKKLLDEELENLSPRLRALRGQDDGFRLPPAYFEGLDNAIFQQIDALGARRAPTPGIEKPGAGSLLAWLWRPRLALAFGTLLAAALTAWWLLRPQLPPAPIVVPIAQINLSLEEAEAYVQANLLDFEPEQLAALASLEKEPAETTEPPAATPGQSKKTAPKTHVELSPEELEILLDDLSDEEIEQML